MKVAATNSVPSVLKEIYLVVCRFRGLQEAGSKLSRGPEALKLSMPSEAVNRQCELLAFRQALHERSSLPQYRVATKFRCAEIFLRIRKEC